MKSDDTGVAGGRKNTFRQGAVVQCARVHAKADSFASRKEGLGLALRPNFHPTAHTQHHPQIIHPLFIIMVFIISFGLGSVVSSELAVK